MNYQVTVNHNMEIAHRLSQLPGKCQQIHGHGMQVYLTIYGDLDSAGLIAGLEFSALKKAFREYIDSVWDHKLHLNAIDPFAKPLFLMESDGKDLHVLERQHFLPGLVAWPGGDPTTENIARWICEAMHTWLFESNSNGLIEAVEVRVEETKTNSVTYSMPWEV